MSDEITLTLKIKFDRPLTRSGEIEAPPEFAKQLQPHIERELLTGAEPWGLAAAPADVDPHSRAWGYGVARVESVEVTPA